MLDKNIKVFVMHIIFLGSKITIYLVREAWIGLLSTKKVVFLAKYLDFADVFSEKLANLLLEKTGANKYAIKLEKDK